MTYVELSQAQQDALCSAVESLTRDLDCGTFRDFWNTRRRHVFGFRGYDIDHRDPAMAFPLNMALRHYEESRAHMVHAVCRPNTAYSLHRLGLWEITLDMSMLYTVRITDEGMVYYERFTKQEKV